MKTKSIYIFISVVVVAFVALICLQIVYMRSLIDIQASEFDAAVHRSLSQVVYLLEQDETRRYLENEMEDNEQDADNSVYGIQLIAHTSAIALYEEDTATISSGYFQKRREQYVGQRREGMTDLHEADFQEKLRERYLYQKDMLEDVIFKILYEAKDVPISQRVDFSKLEDYLEKEFSVNGLSGLAFSFKVVNKYDEDVYFSKDYIETGNPDYKQLLFINDPGDKYAMMHIYFPRRQEYIRRPLWTFIPTIGFSVVLLFVFAFTTLVILRQKKLSDMKNDFISNMTHELKTPVASISLASQMLKDPGVVKEEERVARIVTIMSDESKRLNQLIEKVLQTSMFERSEKTTISFKELDVNPIIESVVSTFVMKVSSYGGVLSHELHAQQSIILADEMHLTNVLFNLLDNAVKYRDENKTLDLSVTTENADEHLLIYIKDNGIGIRKKDQKKLFERFYRVPNGNRHDVKGFGLGLSYVDNVIKSHKGSVSVESEYGRGTTFIIKLPLIKD